MRKIFFPILSRAQWGRCKSVLHCINKHPELELQLFIGGSAVLPKFGVKNDIEKEGLEVSGEIYCTVEGDRHENMATTVGVLITQLVQLLNVYKPDIVFCHADRYEQLAVATAASYMSISICHTQGGERSGNIDDKVRNAISMLADIHFPSTGEARQKLNWIVKDRNSIYVVGCPSIDLLAQMKQNGTLTKTDDKYLMVVMHPVTTDNQNARKAADILRAIEMLKMPTYWIHSNIDPMNTDINEHVKSIIKTRKLDYVTFLDSVSPERFYQLMYNTQCLIGNTSAGIREGAYLGTPYVCLGDRQSCREHDGNTIIIKEYTFREIYNEVLRMRKKIYKYNGIFGYGDAGLKIANALAEITIKEVKY